MMAEPLNGVFRLMTQYYFGASRQCIWEPSMYERESDACKEGMVFVILVLAHFADPFSVHAKLRAMQTGQRPYKPAATGINEWHF